VRLSQKLTRPKGVNGAEADQGSKEKWKVARGRRERLEYTAQRLGLEIEQKVVSPFA